MFDKYDNEWGMTLVNFLDYIKDAFKSVSSIDFSGENIFDVPTEYKFVRVVYDYGRTVEVVDKTDIEMNDGYVVLTIYDEDKFKKVLIPFHNIDYVEWLYE